jgi:hypothetical protein
MEYLIGVSLALSVSLFATAVGFDRHRAFYPTLLIVIASYYALFAVIGGSTHALAIESAFIAAFMLASVLGFKLNLWLVVAALVAHGLFDLAHAHFVSNPGVPTWWPPFCLSYDVAAAAYLAILLRRPKAPTATT